MIVTFGNTILYYPINTAWNAEMSRFRDREERCLIDEITKSPKEFDIFIIIGGNSIHQFSKELRIIISNFDFEYMTPDLGVSYYIKEFERQSA